MRNPLTALTCAALLATTTGVTLAAPPKPGAHKPAKPAHSKMVTTKSGLKYQDLKVGTGPMPKKGQTVIVDYIGTFPNGKKFDASRDHGQPFSFTLGAGQVIPGWDEGVATMRVGGKRRLIVPYTLAYGAEGHPPVIPPKATLIFVIDLHGVH